ncbi:MAG: LamG-like jellyroll fold domain-containing protein, partial [Pirellulales bacterium]
LPQAGIVLSDPDIQGEDLGVKPLRLSLVADYGTVQFASLSGLAVITGANGTSLVAVEGPLNALNAALGTLSYSAAEGFTGLASLSVSLDDLGHSGEGSPLTDVETLSIRVNNPPVAVADHYQIGQIGFDRTLHADSYSQAVLNSGPLAYWRLGDSGPVVEDSAGDYDGTASAATVLGVSGALAGDSNKAASFPDVKTGILVDGAAALAQPAGAFSLEAWVNPSQSMAWQRIVSTRNGPTGGWGFALSNQRLAFTTYGIQDYFLEGHPVPLNQWSHVAVVFDTSHDASFFLNGSFVGKVEGSAQPNAGGSLLAIGDNPDQSAQPFLGKLDEVAFYAKPLTAAEVSRHYQAGLLNTTLLANDSDADGDPLQAILVAGPQHGQLTFAADGAFTYKPNAGFYGPDKFTYRAVDAYFQSAETEVLIDVIPVPGDADLDGDVDLADFGVLKRYFGAGTTREQGDFNGDGKVDLTDFGILKEHFGTVEPSEG